MYNKSNLQRNRCSYTQTHKIVICNINGADMKITKFTNRITNDFTYWTNKIKNHRITIINKHRIHLNKKNI